MFTMGRKDIQEASTEVVRNLTALLKSVYPFSKMSLTAHVKSVRKFGDTQTALDLTVVESFRATNPILKFNSS